MCFVERFLRLGRALLCTAHLLKAIEIERGYEEYDLCLSDKHTVIASFL